MHFHCRTPLVRFSCSVYTPNADSGRKRIIHTFLTIRIRFYSYSDSSCNRRQFFVHLRHVSYPHSRNRLLSGLLHVKQRAWSRLRGGGWIACSAIDTIERPTISIFWAAFLLPSISQGISPDPDRCPEATGRSPLRFPLSAVAVAP